MKFTAHDVISKYFELKDFVEQEEKEVTDRLAPYKEAMNTLKGAAALIAKETGQTSLSTEDGTAFPVTQKRVKCINKDAFLDWVIANDYRQFLTSHVAKDAVIEYVDGAAKLPPGVQLDTYVEWQFRRK